MMGVLVHRVHGEGAGQLQGGAAALRPQDVGVVDGGSHGGVARVVGLEGRGVGRPPGAAATSSAAGAVVHAVDVAGLAAPYL